MTEIRCYDNYDDYVEIAENILDSLDLDIDPENYQSFKECLKNVFPTVRAHHRLSTKLEQFPNEVTKAKRQGKEFNYELMDEIFIKCTKLMKYYEDKPANYETPFVLAVVEYFLADNDAIPDFESKTGFDDDEQILNAIIDRFGLGKFIAIPKTEIEIE